MVEVTLGEFVRIVKRMREAQVERWRIKFNKLSTMREYSDAVGHATELENYVDRLCEQISAGTENTLF